MSPCGDVRFPVVLLVDVEAVAHVAHGADEAVEVAELGAQAPDGTSTVRVPPK